MAILSKGIGKNIHQATTDDAFCSKKPLVLLSTNDRTLEELTCSSSRSTFHPLPHLGCSERAAAPGHSGAAQALRKAQLNSGGSVQPQLSSGQLLAQIPAQGSGQRQLEGGAGQEPAWPGTGCCCSSSMTHLAAMWARKQPQGHLGSGGTAGMCHHTSISQAMPKVTSMSWPRAAQLILKGHNSLVEPPDILQSLLVT